MLGLHFDLNHLVTLALLLQTKSVTRTARRLGVSQPAVSRTLAQLRARLDDPLLVRTSSGMELTRRAADLAGPLDRWLSETTSLFAPADFTPETLDRRFRAASTDFGVAAVIAPALPHLLNAAPDVSIDVLPFTVDMMQKLASGEIDLIITGLEPDRSLAHDRYLFSETYSCVLRRDHPLTRLPASSEAMPVDAFLDWPHISVFVSDTEFDRIDMILGSDAAKRRVITRLPYFQAAPGLIGSSDAIMTLPTRAAHMLASIHDLACIAAPRALAGFDYHIQWHERSHRDPATRWLIDMLVRNCATPPPIALAA